MGKMDMETKAYMSDPFHFADAFNYLIYDGQPVIDPKELRPLDTTEITIPFGNGVRAPEQKFRDVLKLLSAKQDDKAMYVVLGVENQTKVHYAMPVKDMLYDAMNYAHQVEAARKSCRNGESMTKAEFLSGFRRNDKLMPVITLVVYFGTAEWDGPMRIHEMLNTADQRLLRFVPDYRINLIAPTRVPDEDFEKFSTDFGEVLESIKYSRDKEKLMQHTRENSQFSQMNPDTAELINLVTDSKLKLTVKEGKVDMCLAIRELRDESRAEGKLEGINEGMAQGMAQGMAKGIAQGLMEGRIRAYAEMIAEGAVDIHFAAKKLNMTVEEFAEKAGITVRQN